MNCIKKFVIAKKDKFEFVSKGLLVKAEICADGTILRFRSVVFSEKTYIPHSIRECVNNVYISSQKKKLPTILVINEALNTVELIQEFPDGVSVSIVKLLKLFTFVARSWAPILKKIAGQDLLYS